MSETQPAGTTPEAQPRLQSSHPYPWLAASLALIIPGMGHLYLGRWRATVTILLHLFAAINLAYALLLFADFGWVGTVLAMLLCVSIYAWVVNAYIVARRLRAGGSYKPHGVLSYVALVIALTLLFGLAFPLWGTYQAFKMPTSSMENTLKEGDFLIADMSCYRDHTPARGDLVVFLFPVDNTTKYIKRCVGLPGDTLEIRDKVMYLNGEILPDPPTVVHIDIAADGSQNIKPKRDNFGPYVVPPRSYFMIGDNRDNSYDSRYWGCVSKDGLLGKAVRIHWSKDLSRIGLRLDQPAVPPESR